MPVPITRALLICTLTAACVLPSNAALAFCSQPIVPHCVADGTLTDSYVAEDRCRRALEKHVGDLTRYRNCLTAEIDQIDAAVERFRNLLDAGAEKSRSLSAPVPATG